MIVDKSKLMLTVSILYKVKYIQVKRSWDQQSTLVHIGDDDVAPSCNYKLIAYQSFSFYLL